MEKAGLESRLFYVSFILQVDNNFFSWELFPMTIITHILVYDAPFPTSWKKKINVLTPLFTFLRFLDTNKETMTNFCYQFYGLYVSNTVIPCVCEREQFLFC